MQQFQTKWNEELNSDDGEKIKKILAIDGKTQRGNGNKEQKPNHVVSAADENGFCLGQKCVDEKSNEITAIPKLLDILNIKGNIVATDAMGCQTEIVKQIRKKGGDYVLALKGNQGTLYDDVKLYFLDTEFLSKCEYFIKTEKARGGIERREYWQTEDVAWLAQHKNRAGLQSISMTRNTTIKDGSETTETRYFISSLERNVKEITRAIRGHWVAESHHLHLDVTFHEDSSHTLEKQAALNQNILRKLALGVLKIVQMSKKIMSVRMKRFSIGTNPEKHLANILEL